MKFEEHNFQENAVRALRAAGFIVINCDVMAALGYISAPAKRMGFVARLKRQGYAKGQPDIITGTAGQFWALEFKAAKGRQSKEQKEFQKACEFKGLPYRVLKNFYELEKFINSAKDIKIGGSN